jgi:hypothetical protein
MAFNGFNTDVPALGLLQNVCDKHGRIGYRMVSGISVGVVVASSGSL